MRGRKLKDSAGSVNKSKSVSYTARCAEVGPAGDSGVSIGGDNLNNTPLLG
jgi:hypothetical protein